MLKVWMEGADEFSREFGGLKAVKSEFKGRKVLNFQNVVNLGDVSGKICVGGLLVFQLHSEEII